MLNEGSIKVHVTSGAQSSEIENSDQSIILGRYTSYNQIVQI